MKRILAIAMILMALLNLAGCSQRILENPTNGEKVFEEPPELYLQVGEQEIRARGGTYSWDYKGRFNQRIGVEADAIHPLDGKEYWEGLETKETAAFLRFEEQPDQVRAHCWSDAHWGNHEAQSEAVEVDGDRLPLKQGGYIYEVIASWERESYEGTAHYTVYIIVK